MPTFANTINGNELLAKRSQCDYAGNDIQTTYATKSELPTIVGLTAGANVTITEGNNAITIAATDTTYSAGTGLSLSGTTFSNADPLPAHTSTESGKVLGVDSNGELGWVNQSGGGGTTYTAGDGIDITSDVISADVDGTTIGIDSSTKKIKLLPTIPSVDQTYNAASTNAQSGTAVAGALAGKEDAFDVGTGLEMDTSGSTPTLQVEAPVDIVAGPGIVIDNPDGNTLRVSVAQADEVVLYDAGDSPSQAGPWQISEARTNFEWVDIVFGNDSTGSMKQVTRFAADSEYMKLHLPRYDEEPSYKWSTMTLSWNNTTASIKTNSVGRFTIASNGAVSVSTAAAQAPYLFQIIGVHRINGGN